MAISRDNVLAVLARVSTPGGARLTDLDALSDIVISGDKVFFSISVDSALARQWEPVRQHAENAVKGLPGVASVLAVLTAERKPGAVAPPPRTPAAAPHDGVASSGPQPKPGLPGVQSIIAVASGKGGVGKSTTALNLALALRDLGLRVGLLDADIYGPSLPRLLAIHEKPQTDENRRMKPITRLGLQVMSIGFIVEEETPMIWRGPMVMSALTQMLREVAWGELDVLVVDMPPGTGDAQLTMAQQVPLKGAVIVSTPQDLALIDARRGIAMFNRVNVPVLGIVENMSYFLCPHCGQRSDIFGHGGAEHEAARTGVPFLGAIPLDMEIRERSDSGDPIVAAKPDSPHSVRYREIAQKVAASLSSSALPAAPNIVVE